MTLACWKALSAATPTARTRSSCAAGSTGLASGWAAAAARFATEASTAAKTAEASARASGTPASARSSARAGAEASAATYSPRRTSATTSAAARTLAPAFSETAPGAIGGADPAGRDRDDRRRSRSSATTVAAGLSAAGTESFTHEFIVPEVTVRASTRRGRCEDGESPGGPKSQDAADWRIFGEPRQYCDLALARSCSRA